MLPDEIHISCRLLVLDLEAILVLDLEAILVLDLHPLNFIIRLPHDIASSESERVDKNRSVVVRQGFLKVHLRSVYTERLRHRHRNIDGGIFDLFDGTVLGRMGCIPILPTNITFVTVTVTESLGVNEPLHVPSQCLCPSKFNIVSMVMDRLTDRIINVNKDSEREKIRHFLYVAMCQHLLQCP